ncbi:MAG: RHS repeat-associated core domain-containing protein, partial [Thermoanaerobaculia bacterium]
VAPSGAVTQFHLDHLGSTRLVTDAGRNTLEKTEYFPFGEESAAPGPETKKFTGHERDYNAASGWNLDYMHARYYSPALGRFLSVDPVLDVKRSIREPQSWNRYSYVVNNSIRRIDPDGRVDGNSDDFARQLFPDDRAAQLEFDQNVAVRTAGLVAAFGSLFIPGPEDVAIGAFVGSRVGGAAARFWGRLLGRGDAAVDIAKSSRFDDVTKGGSVVNRSTDVTRADFGKNLEAQGFTKSVSKDGKATVYQKDATTYSIYDKAKSTGGPSVLVRKDGELIEKIRLAQ